MATYSPTNEPWKAGYPGQSSDTVNPVTEGLIISNTPGVVMEDMTVAVSQTFATQYVPVAFDGSGNLIPAVWNVSQAVGILMRPITTPSSPIQGVECLRAGCVRMDMVSWPASYDTDEKKLEAFRGAPTPCNILVKKIRSGAIVATP